jgi:nucleoside-diphosphate-sugar epimerase
MTKPLVLITGATGHIGFRTLVKLLEAGYRARVTSRSLASAEKLKHLPSIKPFAGSIEFIEVPDFLADGAFDTAVKDVEYILHLASPLPDDKYAPGTYDLDEVYLQPAIRGTVGMLEAASKSPSVKRVVITASVAILGPQPNKSTVGPDDLKPAFSRELMESNPWIAYSGSKIAAFQAAQNYLSTNTPSYSVIWILPAYVQGRNEPVTTSKQLYDGPSSNHTLIQYLTGKKNTAPRPQNFVHVDDVAAVEIGALSSTKAKDGERFIVSAPRFESYSVFDPIVRKLFPEEVKSGILPLGGEQPVVGVDHDTSNTREVFGLEFKGLEEMVQSLVGQYVELVKKEKAST